jgi:hypothetical protein
MWTEMKSTECTSFISSAQEAATLDDVVQSVKARGGEILIVGMDVEVIQWTEVVDAPFPCVTKGVIEA